MMKKLFSITGMVLACLLLSGFPLWAANLVASGTSPWTYYDNTDTENYDWYTGSNAGGYTGSYFIYGKGNYPFLIEHGTPSYTMYLDSGISPSGYSGRIGIGTTVPLYKVDVIGDEIRLRNSTSTDAKTVQIRTDGDGSDIDVRNTRLFIRTDNDGVGDDIIILPGTTGNVGIGTGTPAEKFSVRREWANPVGDGLTRLCFLSANNTAIGYTSDAGFTIKNERANFQWAFRTTEATRGFMATKEGTGGAEFILSNPTSDYRNVTLQMGNGATCNSLGQWVDGSSRDYKENIVTLSTDEALETLKALTPVKFNFKRDEKKELNVGFIAEDVPDLVSTKDRKGMNALEVVALLTKVVQQQQEMVRQQQIMITQLSDKVRKLESQKNP